MSIKKPQDPSLPLSPSDLPDDPSRRRLIGGMALAGAAVAAGGGNVLARAKPVAPARSDSELDAQLRKHVQHVVVIYAENRSFNNLFADFPGLEKPLSSVQPHEYQQRDRDGTLLKTLPPIWGGMVPREQVVDHRKHLIKESDITGLANAPFTLKTTDGQPLPHGLVTRDLWHSFYQNQLQINGGKNDGFVGWGDSGAMVMGHYGDTRINLRL
jgi:phospholipase C